MIRKNYLYLIAAACISVVCLISCSETPIVDSDNASDPTRTVRGYWHWTYHQSTEPSNTNLSIAFFGSVDPATAIQQSLNVKQDMLGEQYICLGGGNSHGKWTSDAIEKIVAAVRAKDFAGYDGLALDIEVGASHLEEEFAQLFAVAQANDLDVLVTVSHSDPFGVGDKSTLMESFFGNSDIDYISPQLYTTGKETANDYDAVGIPFSDYARSIAPVIPSIVRAEFYEDAVKYFKAQGVGLAGYIQWQQNAAETSESN